MSPTGHSSLALPSHLAWVRSSALARCQGFLASLASRPVPTAASDATSSPPLSWPHLHLATPVARSSTLGGIASRRRPSFWQMVGCTLRTTTEPCTSLETKESAVSGGHVTSTSCGYCENFSMEAPRST